MITFPQLENNKGLSLDVIWDNRKVSKSEPLSAESIKRSHALADSLIEALKNVEIKDSDEKIIFDSVSVNQK